jgi:serine/threonine protein kinase, bacterial
MISPLSPGTLLHQRYGLLEVLKAGRCGWIYLAADQKRTGQCCVLEEWELPEEIERDRYPTVLNEFQPLLELHHPQLPHYQVAFIENHRCYFVRDQQAGTPIRKFDICSEIEILSFLQQILPVLSYLHKHNIIHQNLTPDSVWFDDTTGSAIALEFGLKSFAPSPEYAPLDQQFDGRVTEDVDLYALAAICVVLLTGCSPQELYEEKTQRWTWLPFAAVSPQLAHILDRMLSPNPPRRYATATKVMQALQGEEQQRDFTAIAFSIILIALAAIAAWRMIFHIEQKYSPTPIETVITIPKERSSKVKTDFLNQLANEMPENGLAQLAKLSQESQQGLGSYKRTKYNTWLTKAKQKNMSERSLEVLTDAQFVNWFPRKRGKSLDAKTWGQVWYAIAQDQVNSISPKTIQPKAQLKETLTDGQGKLYLANFQQGQTIRLAIETSGPIRLSIFPPGSAFPILRNSTEKTWSGKIQRSGIYEIVVTPDTAESVSYLLKLEK